MLGETVLVLAGFLVQHRAEPVLRAVRLVGDDHNRRVLHLRLLHQLSNETRHRDAFARALRMPDDATLARSRFDTLAIGRAWFLDNFRFRLWLSRCNHCYTHRLTYCVKLVIAR